MKFLLGTKEYMTQVFGEDGKVEPVTVIKAGPVTVTQIKTSENDGYNAVQIGFGNKREKLANKAQVGHAKGQLFRHFLENVIDSIDEVNLKVGDVLDVSLFKEGDEVITSSVSKGKGFQGVVKRHGFAGGRRSHGNKHSEREAGSIGGGGRAGGRVVKGMRMAGRMGNDRVTQKKVKVVGIDAKAGEIYIRGSVAGRRGTLVEIRG